MKFNRNLLQQPKKQMQHSQSHASSARKKLLEFQQTIKRQQSQSGYLGRTLSREHSKMMESILRQGLEKDQTDRAINRDYSTRGYQSNLSNQNNTPSSSAKKLKSPSLSNNKINPSGSKINLSTSKLDIQLSSLNTTFKPLKTSISDKYQEIRIDTNEQNSSVLQQQTKGKQQVPQFYNDTDEIRSARQNELMEVKKTRFKFSLPSYFLQILIGYCTFVGIMFLIKLGSFPYFQLLFIIALTLSMHPWRISSLILPLSGIPIIIVNHYLGLSSLTYIEILICYVGVMAFNQKHKIKFFFIIVLVTQVLFGLFVFPSLYKLMKGKQEIYFYIFPLLMFLLRNLVQVGYWVVGFTSTLYLQVPLFLIGLEYGTILTIPVGEIEFWYLIVFFTLQVMNDRTHFILKALTNMIQFCLPSINNTTTTLTPDSPQRNNHLLPAHWNGFSSTHSFHLIACVYIMTSLPLSSSPYNDSFRLSTYLQNNQWYKPLIVWGLISVYEVMCIVLVRKRQNVMLIGQTSNRWYVAVYRGVVLALGLWMFYIGLGIAAYSVQTVI